MSEEKIDTTEREKTKEVSVQKEEAPAIPPHREYARRMSAFETYYLQLVCCIGAMAAIGVVCAVVYKVVLGAIICAVSAGLYAYLTADEMYKKIGVRYSSGAGGVTALKCTARYGDVFWLPPQLIWFDVIRIGDRAFCSKNNKELTRVFLPDTVREIGEDIFEGCDALTDIFYQGTSEMWEQINCKSDLSGYRITFEAKYPPIPKKKRSK